MRQDGVVSDLVDRPWRQLQPGSKLPGFVAKVANANEFVGCEKVLNAIRQVLRDVASVVSEGLRSIPRLPASRQRLRQIPVKQRYIGRDAVLEQLVDDAVVISHTSVVGLTRSVRENPRPGDRHAVALHAQALQELHVVLIEMVGIVGHVASVALKSLAGRVRENVPIRLPAPILVDATLNLIRSSSATPEEAIREAQAGRRLTEGDAGDGRSGKSGGRGSSQGFTKLAAG